MRRYDGWNAPYRRSCKRRSYISSRGSFNGYGYTYGYGVVYASSSCWNYNYRTFGRYNVNGFIASYIHAGGKIGVLVDVETDVVNDAVKEMAKNVAMQAAALKPLYTSDAEVEPDYIEKEKAILMAQIQNDPKESQKPEKVIQGMIQGRINKELKEICLLDQVYVKAEDGKQSVGKYVEQVAKENNAKITIKGFVRFETGEGIEKKEENFAEEVAKQMAGK